MDNALGLFNPLGKAVEVTDEMFNDIVDNWRLKSRITFIAMVEVVINGKPVTVTLISAVVEWGPWDHTNGYIYVPKQLKDTLMEDGEEYQPTVYDLLNNFMNVHGGLTYGEPWREGWLFGFDTAHAWDEGKTYSMDYFIEQFAEMVRGVVKSDMFE